MTFYEWVKQQTKRKDPIGRFARSVTHYCPGPLETKEDWINAAGTCYHKNYVDTIESAWKEYAEAQGQE